MSMRTGWICPRCNRSLSPDTPSCDCSVRVTFDPIPRYCGACGRVHYDGICPSRTANPYPWTVWYSTKTGECY